MFLAPQLGTPLGQIRAAHVALHLFDAHSV
jgi:hypothetical protein